jgi:hypothetical protein
VVEMKKRMVILTIMFSLLFTVMSVSKMTVSAGFDEVTYEEVNIE